MRALPEAGGVLDQDPDIMAAFDGIGAEVRAWEEKARKKKG